MIPGQLENIISASKRHVEDKTNLKHFFALGLVSRYPNLDEETLVDALESPNILMQEGYLQATERVHPSLRERISKLIVQIVTPTPDLGELVQTVEEALQHNLMVTKSILESASDGEKLTPHELRRLLLFLVPLDSK